MARRKKSGVAEDLFEIVAMFPWWVGVVLALVAYVFLHSVASSPVVTPLLPGQMGQAMGQQLYKTFALFGQYLLPLICLAGAAASAVGRARRRQLVDGVAKSPSVGALNGMSWQEFELLVGEAFRRKGFAVREIGGGGADGGVDLVLIKDGGKTLVQCKQWKAFKVGVNIVRELYGVMAAQGAAGGYVVTSGQFTREARDFAAGRNISLMDGAALTDFISGVVVPRQEPRISDSALRQAPADTVATACPKCGSPMVKRVAKTGSRAGNEFLGCSTFPACRGTVGM